MKLEELKPELHQSVEYAGAQHLTFLCPKCRQRIVTIDIWGGKACDLQYEPDKIIKLWHAEQGPQSDWSTLTITPSIDTQHNSSAANGCKGWHGFVTNGEVT